MGTPALRLPTPVIFVIVSLVTREGQKERHKIPKSNMFKGGLGCIFGFRRFSVSPPLSGSPGHCKKNLLNEVLVFY